MEYTVDVIDVIRRVVQTVVLLPRFVTSLVLVSVSNLALVYHAVYHVEYMHTRRVCILINRKLLTKQNIHSIN